jgi:hypothetical protein
MNFPAYWGDPNLKREVLARAARADWQSAASLNDLLPPDQGTGPPMGSPLHRLTGFPASLTLMADMILRHLPADRRGRFAAAVFDAPDVGADLAPIADQVLAAMAQMLPARHRPALSEAMPVRDYAPKLEALLAQSGALGAGFGWMECADLLVEVLAGATPP